LLGFRDAASRWNACGQSPHAPWVIGGCSFRAARAGFACSRRMSPPPRKTAAPVLRSGLGGRSLPALHFWGQTHGSDPGLYRLILRNFLAAYQPSLTHVSEPALAKVPGTPVTVYVDKSFAVVSVETR